MESHERTVIERELQIPVGEEAIAGTLAVPGEPAALVLFAHGSGSSRFSGRNRFVSKFLTRSNIATLLLDLLTPREAQIDAFTAQFRFDIDLLAARLVQATRVCAGRDDLRGLPMGYFGASTGAAAALIAAVESHVPIGAIISRGGRPDLAGQVLPSVPAPTLLIVGGEDAEVIELNRQAFELLQAPKALEVIPGATHLFEEPGTLERVADLARDWFLRHLTRTGMRQAGTLP
jgi:predicted alpha/beta-hydrolase family hydrolase